MSTAGQYAQKLSSPHITKTDAELVDWVEEWVCRMYKNPNREWRISIPVDFDNDPDVLIMELAARFRELANIPRELLPPEETS